MCKVIALTDGSNIKNFDEFVSLCMRIVSDQKDGFGYAALGVEGVFGYRTVMPSAGYVTAKMPDFVLKPFETYGKCTPVVGPVILHGRISTNVADIKNTHPIVKNNWHLIHNGVVNHHGLAYERMTQNDSEHVLHNLITGGIEAVASNLTGYYAFAAIDPDGILHVARDRTAPLYYAYLPSIGSGVFTTNEAMLHAIASFFKDKVTPMAVIDETYLRYDGNDIIEHCEFDSLGFGYDESQHAFKSLGYNLDDYNDDGRFNDMESDYWDEIQYLDDTYQIFDARGKLLGVDEFNTLNDAEKILCTVIRPDGTWVEATPKSDENDYPVTYQVRGGKMPKKTG